MSIAITYTTPEKEIAAIQLGQQLHLPVLSGLASASDYDFLLTLTPDYLGLIHLHEKNAKPFYIDFASKQLLYRSQQASRKKELIAKAMGVGPKAAPRIIDATAGLGRDSFILASVGFEVTMLERSPIMHALLKDGLDRAAKNQYLSDKISKLRLIFTKSTEWLSNIKPDEKPDIIYIDPMFPERKKSASVKKDMAFMQKLLGSDTDCDELFRLALTCATRRVVVKRPTLAGNIAEMAPNFSIAGKSSRFDIYIT